MFKRITIAITILLCMVGVSSASLTTIGTATYNGGEYNLIWQTNIDKPIIWLDYTKEADDQLWETQNNWANNIGSNLTYAINPGYTVNFEEGFWRLPESSISNIQTYGNYSELSSLYYDEFGFTHHATTEDLNETIFDHLIAGYYWLGEFEGSTNPSWAADCFNMSNGFQIYMRSTSNTYNGIAVFEGGNVQVNPVPIPAAVWLLGPGLLGMGVVRKKFK